MIVRQDGSVWSTGVNANVRSSSFAKVISTGATAVSAGNCFSIVLKKDGSVWTAGSNSEGQHSFPDGSITRMREFSVLKMITGAKAVSAGGHHSMVLTQEGGVWVTGWNKYGQSGNSSTTFDGTQFFTAISSGATAIAAGDLHSLVLKQDGSVWAAGRNDNGQLGDGSTTDRSLFVKVMASGAVAVAAGGYHSMVLTRDGSVWATGWNEYGQLGDGTTTNRINYAHVIRGGATAIAAGSRHSMILEQDGSVWATGYNRYGQLGDGGASDSGPLSQAYVRVMSDGVKFIAAGAFHSMLIKQDGSVWATGSNEYGQFGDSLITSSGIFIKLAPLSSGAGFDMIRQGFLRKINRWIYRWIYFICRTALLFINPNAFSS